VMAEARQIIKGVLREYASSDGQVSMVQND
jgi:hypothetical protein